MSGANRPERSGAGGSGPGAAVATPVLDAMWQLWLPVAWILPVILILIRFVNGGWETLILMIFSPVFIPGIALLAALPRFILRKRSWRHAPASVASLMIASAWGLTIAFLTVRGSGDSGTINSPLRIMFSGLTERSENLLSGFGVLLALTCYLAAVVVASVLAASSPKSGTLDPRPILPPKPAWWLRSRDLLPIAVLVLTPLIAAATTGIGVAIMQNGTKDFAGKSEANMAALDEKTLTTLRDGYWDRLQEQAVPVRTGIAEDGWLVAAGGGVRNVLSKDRDRYRLFASWEVLLDGDPETLAARALSVAEAQGWERELATVDATGNSDPLDPSPRYRSGPPEEVQADKSGMVVRQSYRLRNAAGYLMVLSAAVPERSVEEGRAPGTPIPQSYVHLDVSTGVYWDGNRALSDRVATWDDSPEGQKLWSNDPTTFRGNEWPTLLAVDAGWSREWRR